MINSALLNDNVNLAFEYDKTDTLFYSAFQQGKSRALVISKKKYNNKYFIDIRTWLKSGTEKRFFATKKGIFLNCEELADSWEEIKRVMDSYLEEKRVPNIKVLNY